MTKLSFGSLLKENPHSQHFFSKGERWLAFPMQIQIQIMSFYIGYSNSRSESLSHQDNKKKNNKKIIIIKKEQNERYHEI